MGVFDGQSINAAVTNAALMSRLNNTSTIGRVDVNNTTDSTGTTDGALHVAGGAGIEKNLYVGQSVETTGNVVVGGTLDVTGPSNVAALTSTGLIQANDITATDVLTGNSLVVTTSATVGTTLDVTGNTSLSTVSTSGLATLNSASVGTTLGVTGNTTLSTLSTTGLATLNSAQTTGILNVGTDLTVTGNLTVNGTTTTVGTTNLVVTDKNIVVNNGGTDATSEGAGITVDRSPGTDGSLIYKNASATKFAIGALGSEVDIADISTAQSFSNKTISGATNTISNISLTTGVTGTLPIANGGTGQTTANTALNALLPTQTGQTGKVLKTDGTNASWGTGGGSGGGVNLIADGDYEGAVQIFTPYNDSSTTRPIDGTGGVATVTAGFLLSPAIRGTGSFTLTKPASNCQGQGWAIANTAIDPEFRAKPLRFSFAYRLNVAGFNAGSNGASPTDGDFIVTFYDLSNSKIVEGSNIKFFSNSTTLVDTFECTVQFDSNCTSVRPIIHVASTSAVANDMFVDSVSLSPQLVNQGALMTNFFPVAAPAITGNTSGTYNPGTGSVYTCEVSHQGQEIIARYYLDIGTGPTEPVGAYQFAFPSGYTPDASELSFENMGYGSVQTVGATPVARIAIQKFGNVMVVMKTDGALLTAGDGIMSASTNIVSFTIRYKVQGQSASVKMSEPGDGRIVSFSGTQTSQAVTANVTDIAFTATNNRSGNWNGTQFEVKSAGDYVAFATWVSTAAANGGVWLNGTQIPGFFSTAGAGGLTNGTLPLFGLKAGDLISFRNNTTSTITTGSAGIFKLSGSEQITAGEKIAAIYTSTSGQVIPNAAFTIVNYANKEEDTHSLVTTGAGWAFKPKSADYYTVSAKVLFTSGGGWGVGGSGQLAVFKNGVEHSRLGILFVQAANTTFLAVDGKSRPIYLKSDDTIDVRVYQDSGAGLALNTGANVNWVAVSRGL